MNIFKEYDIRGIYPSELNEEIAYKIGRAAAIVLKADRIVVGKDMRISADTMFNALVKGINDQGVDVIDIGLCSTPMNYFAVAHYDNPAGIMVTASHNPKEYNGFKISAKNAKPVSYNTGINEIEKLVKENKFCDSKTKGKIIKKEIIENYVEFISKKIKDVKSMRIVVDAANAMASLTVPKVFEKSNCEIIPLFFELDGTFPNHEPNPLKQETLQDVQKKVIEQKADLGVEFDGDADRVGFVDDKGRTINNDLITAIISKETLKKNPGSKIGYDIRSTHSVREIISENKGTPLVCKVGHVNMKALLRDNDGIFGGELSGHYFFREFFYADCAILALATMLNIISETGKKLSELVDDVERYATSGEINSEIEDKDAKIKEIEAKYQGGKIDHLDGVTIEFNDWWFNLRKSNTEPKLRLRVEAKTEEMLKEKTDELLKIIRG